MIKSRNTRQKETIERALEKQRGFFSVEEIYQDSRKIDKTIGMATIYRFLKELKRKNKINSYLCNRRIIYSKEKTSHCHFICDKTGKTIHFNIDKLDFLHKIEKQIPGKIKSFQLELHGTCNDCNKC